MDIISFSVIGGDMRQIRLAEMLQSDGHNVITYLMEDGFGEADLPRADSIFDAFSGCDCLVLPLPVLSDTGNINAPLSKSKLTMTELLGAIKPQSLVVGGKFDKLAVSAIQAGGAEVVDYLLREDFAYHNAIPTAEGAIQIAMEELPITLQDSRSLIIGYGRIGKLLSAKLKALGADVSVSARKQSDLSLIEALGMRAIKAGRLEPALSRFDLVVNTVPGIVLEEKHLRLLRNDCLCIDLASKPGGIDFDTAASLSIKVIWALSLPGKVAPLTSGKIVKNVIYNIIEERWGRG